MRKLNQGRSILKPKEQRALLKAVNPCYGTGKCILFMEREHVPYANPAKCPVGPECLTEFGHKYEHGEFGIGPNDYRLPPHIRRKVLKTLKGFYLSIER